MRVSAFTAWVRWPDRHSLEWLAFPGVYVLAHSARNLERRPFSWHKEITYIGMTNAKGGLGTRIKQFDETIAGKRVSHGGADRVRYKYRHYGRFTTTFYVSVCAIPCNVKTNSPKDLLSMGDVAKLEYECFAAFVRKFGRLPQFNDKAKAPKYSLTVGRKA